MGKFFKMLIIGVAVFMFLSFMGSCIGRCMGGGSGSGFGGSGRGHYSRGFGK